MSDPKSKTWIMSYHVNCATPLTEAELLTIFERAGHSQEECEKLGVKVCNGHLDPVLKFSVASTVH